MHEPSISLNGATKRQVARDAGPGPIDHAGGSTGDSTVRRHTIAPEAAAPIIVGAGGQLVVPHEDMLAGEESGEVDLSSARGVEIRKPGRREWIVLNPGTELSTRLLIQRLQPDAYEVDYYFVEPSLRGPIAGELKSVRVFQYFSLGRRTHGLWVVGVTPDNSWYESLAHLFHQPADFFARNRIRVTADKQASRYRAYYEALAEEVAWPGEGTGKLLGDALGPDRFIRSPDHPAYRDLTGGKELM